MPASCLEGQYEASATACWLTLAQKWMHAAEIPPISPQMNMLYLVVVYVVQKEAKMYFWPSSQHK